MAFYFRVAAGGALPASQSGGESEKWGERVEGRMAKQSAAGRMVTRAPA